MGVSGQRHAPAAVPLGEDTVPVVQEAGWVPQRYLPNKLSLICLKILAAALCIIVPLSAVNGNQFRWGTQNTSRSQLPRGLSRRSTAARLLRSRVRIPPGAWMSVCCECYVSSGRGLCEALITRPEESYRLCCVVVCDLETSWMRRLWAAAPREGTEY